MHGAVDDAGAGQYWYFSVGGFRRITVQVSVLFAKCIHSGIDDMRRMQMQCFPVQPVRRWFVACAFGSGSKGGLYLQTAGRGTAERE